MHVFEYTVLRVTAMRRQVYLLVKKKFSPSNGLSLEFPTCVPRHIGVSLKIVRKHDF